LFKEYAIIPIRIHEKINDGPASPAGTPKSTKIQIPIIAPIPILARPIHPDHASIWP